MLEKARKVRLSARGLRFQKVSGGYIGRGKRVGTNSRLSRDETRAQAVWEDDKTMSDPLPLAFLEAIEEQRFYGRGKRALNKPETAVELIND
jgi:hypothetical protein